MKQLRREHNLQYGPIGEERLTENSGNSDILERDEIIFTDYNINLIRELDGQF